MIDPIDRQACEDAVSREDAIRWVKTECNPYGKPTLDFESGKKVIEYLKSMPPVTPKRKKGKWKKAYLDHEAFGERPKIFYCSVCNQCIICPTNFCPSCGADMRGDADE